MRLESKYTLARKMYMLITALTAWVALVLQLYLMLQRGPSFGISPINTIINFFSFFTILSNVLVAISFTFSFVVPSTPAGRFFSRANIQSAITVYIFIVGLVYNLVLRNLWSPTGQQLIADNLLHVVVPDLYVLYWFLFIKKRVLQWRYITSWLLFPILYLLYSLVRGAVTGWYAYPFINAGQLGYAKVTVNCILVALAILGFGLLLILINRKMKKPEPSKLPVTLPIEND